MGEQLQEKIYEAFVFGLPSYELARTRYNDQMGTQGQPPLPANTVHHGRSLSGADDRWITTPNNDTLYSRAWLDLSKGPVTVAVEAQPPGRYWSVALMDARTQNFALLGQRLHGEGPARITLVGPQGEISGAGEHAVRAPSNDVWLLARWIVEGEHDLAEARAMQDRLSILAAPSVTPVEVVPTDAMDPENFLAVVAEQLARNPLEGPDAARMVSLASAGILPGEKNLGAVCLPRCAMHGWPPLALAISASVKPRSVADAKSMVGGCLKIISLKALWAMNGGPVLH